MGAIRVVEPGLLTTVQDARGRPGLGRFGIPPGGALDAGAARLANRLVGNDPLAAVLEIALAGPTLAMESATHLAITGADLGAVGEHHRLVPGHSYRLRAGATLRFGPARSGARTYLAVEGGVVVESVLGSASTDRRSGFGGLDGRALRVGDVIATGPVGDPRPRRSVIGGLVTGPGDGPIRVVPVGPSFGWFDDAALAALASTAWSVAPDADRSGIRLVGGRLAGSTGSIPSLGVPVGAVQVPPGGEPIITMADGPVTGGYPLIGVVAAADLDRCAQLGPGDPVGFRLVSVDEARSLGSAPAAIEIDPGDVGAGWAG